MKASHRIFGIIVGLAVTAGLIAFTFAYDWFGPLIADESGKIDTVYRWLLVASIPFFVIIVAMIAFVIVEFRADPEEGNSRDGDPLHGSTKLEIVWTVIPTIIVIALGAYAWFVLDQVEAKQPNEMKINVVGQQFAWNYEYPSLGVKTSGDLVVPKGRALYFEMTSVDVIHSFYVPNARLKRDTADGFTTRLRFTPDKLGSYPIVCAELCGIGHTTMRGTLRVVTPAEFKAWVARQKADPAPETGANTISPLSEPAATAATGSAEPGK